MEYQKEPEQRGLDSHRCLTEHWGLTPFHSRCSWLSLGQTLSQKYCINSILKDNPKIKDNPKTTFETSCPEQYKLRGNSEVLRTAQESRWPIPSLFLCIMWVQSVICFYHRSPLRKQKCLAWIIINYKCRVTTQDFRDQKKSVPNTMSFLILWKLESTGKLNCKRWKPRQLLRTNTTHNEKN